MIKKSLVVLAVSVALTAGVFAAPEKPAKPQTVGEFAVKVNAALGKVSADQKTAADSLKALGVDLGKDLSAALTEQRAASILRELGVRVAPGNSNSELSAAKADQLVSAVSFRAGAAPSIAPTTVTCPGDPVCVCLEEKNRGQCEVCCKPTLCPNDPGCDPAADGLECPCATVCARQICRAIIPGGPSPSEPQ